MKTARQMYQEYLETQSRRLERLEEEKKRIELDIEAVKEMLEACPYEEISSDE